MDEDPRSTGGSDEEEGISREGGEEKVGDIITVVVNEGKINSQHRTCVLRYGLI